MPAAALSPQLLSRASEPPNGGSWIHEIKYDGFRMLASRERGRVALTSRPGADWTSRLPGITKAIESLGADGVRLDGELVYLTDDGFPDFERLRSAAQSKDGSRLYYQVFDLLSIGRTDLTSRPLLERKQRLVELLRHAEHPRLRYVAHVEGSGADFFRAVDQLGLEGIVCKRARSLYRAGVRSADWVKVKCFRTQTFAIVGYTLADEVLESLALAGRDGEQLVYAGRVEFGVPRSDRTLLNLLQSLGEPTAEIGSASRSRTITWVEPRLSAEVRALAWAPGRGLRHAVLAKFV
ncbi:MAG: non-homologous end-joining DNA ligase [Gemmatimonadaceae bacterium]